MKCNINLLVHPGEKNINGVLYEKESYINALNAYIHENGKLYIKDETFYMDYNINYEYINIIDNSLCIGKILSLNDDYTITVDIEQGYYDTIKDNIDIYFIMNRLASDKIKTTTIIKKIICMEISFIKKDKGENTMKTIIIAGFPGVGKSVLFKEYGKDKVADSDSSQFSWLIDEDGNKVRHPDFPNNYIEHIKSLIGNIQYVCVSTHDTVIKALQENNIEFFLIQPTNDCKSIYLDNYKARGNDDGFIAMIDKNWDNFLSQLDNCGVDASHRFLLDKNIYLKDKLNFIEN